MAGDVGIKVDRINQAARREEIVGPEIIQAGKDVRHSAPGNVNWFRLTNVSSSPMTGRECTCQDGVFSEVNEIDVAIYTHPQINLSHYNVGNDITAVYIGNCWVALYTQPIPVYWCT